MVHNNLGHRLPAENTSSMFKQMEQPMKHKPPSLGWSRGAQSTDLHGWHCTRPSGSPEAIAEAVPQRSLQGGWGGKAEPGSGPTLHSSTCRQRAVPSGAGDCSRSPELRAAMGQPGAAAGSSRACPAPCTGPARLRAALWESHGSAAPADLLLSKAWAIAPLLSFPSHQHYLPQACASQTLAVLGTSGTSICQSFSVPVKPPATYCDLKCYLPLCLRCLSSFST